MCMHAHPKKLTKHTVCSPDNSLSPLESISPDDKSPLLVVGDGSDCGPPPCGVDRGIGLTRLAFDVELNPVAPALPAVNSFVTDVSVASVVVNPFVEEERFAWLGRML